MANQLRSKLVEFMYSHTLFLRVIYRNMNYDLYNRPGLYVIKYYIGLKLMHAGFHRFGYNDWLDAHIKEDSTEAHLERSKIFESTTTRLQMLKREVDAINVKQIHARADEDNKAVPTYDATS